MATCVGVCPAISPPWRAIMKRFLIAGIIGTACLLGCTDVTSEGLLGEAVSSMLDGAVQSARDNAAVSTDGERLGGRPRLTEEQRAALESIRTRVEAGEITHEQARAEVEALGIVPPPHPPHPPFWADLSEEQRAALESIRTRVEAGEITHEQARAEVEALGIKPPPPPPFLVDLSEEQRAALESIRMRVRAGEITREAARAEAEALGIDLPPPPMHHGHGRGGPMGGFHPRGFGRGGPGGPGGPAALSAEQHTALQALHARVQAGDISREEAMSQARAIFEQAAAK